MFRVGNVGEAKVCTVFREAEQSQPCEMVVLLVHEGYRKRNSCTPDG